MKPTQRLRQIVALSLVPKMGPVGFKNGLMAFGSLEGIFSGDWTKVERLNRLDKQWLDEEARSFRSADEEIERAALEKVEIISYFDELYPAELKQIYDPPIVLYVKGRLPERKHLHVAVVGSRAASLNGLKNAERVSRELAASGAVVVSGLARGIDTAAHKGALDASGLTVAVMGSGFLDIYPPENKKLVDQIAEKGAVITEYNMRMAPVPGNFPCRNRLISGLSRAVLVAEARQKSGALITADLALEQGKDVFALPGQSDSAKAMGSNRLIKQGARFITDAEDILQEYKLQLRRSRSKARELASTDEERRLLSCLEDVERLHLDDLIAQSELPAPKAMSLLSVLAVKGAVQELPGKYFAGK